MDEASHTPPADARHDRPLLAHPERPVPTTRQVVVRAAAAGLVLVLGTPVAARLLLAGADADPRSPWWPVLLLAMFGPAHLVLHAIRRPRPELVRRGGRGRLDDVIVHAVRVHEPPADQLLRTAAGVRACWWAEGTVMLGAAALAAFLTALSWPAFTWMQVTIVLAVVMIVRPYRDRYGWAYLKLLHSGTG
jgi:hypothetical protein